MNSAIHITTVFLVLISILLIEGWQGAKNDSKTPWISDIWLLLHSENWPENEDSSNVNEVIRAVLNSLFFLRKDFACTKSTKSTKNTKMQPSKSTKRYKRTKIKMRLKNILGEKSHLFAYLRFCAFCAR